MGSDTCSRPPPRAGLPRWGKRRRGGAAFPRAPARLLLSLCPCFAVRFFVHFIFSVFFSPLPSLCLCVCLWPAGPPLPCSSASSTPRSQSPSPLPSPPANEGPGRSLGDGAARAAAGSDSEEEFVPQSFLVQSGSGNLCVAANGE